MNIFSNLINISFLTPLKHKNKQNWTEGEKEIKCCGKDYQLCKLGIELFTTDFQLLTTLKKKSFENIVGKGENAGNQHFLPFPQCFLPF